jgi:hypothetical protein
MNTFETKMTWHVYDGESAPKDSSSCLVLSGEMTEPKILRFFGCKWATMDGKHSWPILYGDIWAQLPTADQFPDVKITVDVEIKERSS